MQRIRHIATTVGWAGLVSFASLFAAWGAIIMVIEKQSRLAILFSVAAFLLDTLDGFLARRLGKSSDFGRQLDSMIDSINYSLLAGLVTALILLPSAIGFVLGFFILAFGILRLVLFNINGYIEEGDKRYYSGVVTPHLTLAVVAIYYLRHLVVVPDLAVIAVLAILALGQLSTIKTLKTGALLFWIPVSLLIAVGAFFWQ